MSVVLRLTIRRHVARGDPIAAAAQAPEPTGTWSHRRWLSGLPLSRKSRLLLKHTTRTTRAIVSAVDGALDLDQVQIVPGGRIGAQRHRPPAAAHGRADRRRAVRLAPPHGAFLLIDSESGQTLGWHDR